MMYLHGPETEFRMRGMSFEKARRAQTRLADSKGKMFTGGSLVRTVRCIKEQLLGNPRPLRKHKPQSLINALIDTNPT